MVASLKDATSPLPGASVDKCRLYAPRTTGRPAALGNGSQPWPFYGARHEARLSLVATNNNTITLARKCGGGHFLRMMKLLSGFWRLTAGLLCIGVVPHLFGAETTAAPELQVADQFYLAIPKAAFGKDYLFSASMIPQGQSPTSRGLAGKVVEFELFPDGVDMYESTKGLVVTKDLPARRLLASFPIVRQETNRVVIDFNKGMRQVFTQSWTDGGGLDLNQHDSVLAVPDSRVFSMREENGNLVIRQSVQAHSRSFDQDVQSLYEVRYFITPYEAGDFKGKEPNPVDSRYTRFFETEGQIELGSGRVSSRIDRFDLQEPVVFYYSANTPPEYVQPIKDAVLYWNRAFGKKIVEIKEAPPRVTAPDAEHNIIQWVPWDKAGFAYADLLVNPLDGQSEHGQAYITSAFSFVGKARARALLRAMEEIARPDQKGKDRLTAHLGVPFLDSAECCQLDTRVFARQMAEGLQELLASDELTDKAVLRVSQDYLRQVVAHETGHILGLRHNFAGSLAGTLSAKGLDDWFKAYIAGGSLAEYTNKLVSNSLMEYSVFKADVFIGWQIRTLQEALPHDRAAIQWGYYDSPAARTNKMLFATDEDQARYADVRTFDYGSEPVVGDYATIAQTIDLLPNNVIETFIRALAPQNPNDRIPLRQVNLDYTVAAREIVSQFANQLLWFKADTRSLRVENQFDYIGELNRKERQQAHWKFLNEQIAELHGVDRALFSELPPEFQLDLNDAPTNLLVVPRVNATNLTAKLKTLLASTNYITFVGLDEKKHSFSAEDRQLILERGRKYFEGLERELVKQMCLQLEKAPRDLGVEAAGSVGENDIVAKLEKRIIAMAKHVITTTDETNRISGQVDKSYVEVPGFKYDQKTRLAAARMLNKDTGSFDGWADDAKSELHEQLNKQLEAALNINHFKDFQPSLLSRPLREWYLQQQELLKLLPETKPPGK
jgi:hypothetical protein